jgi:hypothetical protein
MSRIQLEDFPDPRLLAESLSPERLISKLRSGEDAFVERKSKSQKGDWLQVAVAFANSTPIGYPAVLFVGASDEGLLQATGTDSGKALSVVLEEWQKSINDVLNQAYPPIYRHLVSIQEGEKGCVAVVIPGSEHRPHFAGKSYVRKGPSVIEASEEQFEALIAERKNIVYELRKLIGKEVLIEHFLTNHTGSQGRLHAVIVDCNQHFLSYRFGTPESQKALPISRIAISFDHKSKTTILQTWDPK